MNSFMSSIDGIDKNMGKLKNQALELCIKHGLDDEVKMIEQEEDKLHNLLQEQRKIE